MSRTPLARQYSASLRVDTVIGPSGERSPRRATSIDLAVLTCWRRLTPSVSRCARMRAMLRSSLASSSTRQGVSSWSSFTAVLVQVTDGDDDIEVVAVSYTHLRAHETRHDLVCRL